MFFFSRFSSLLMKTNRETRCKSELFRLMTFFPLSPTTCAGIWCISQAFNNTALFLSCVKTILYLGLLGSIREIQTFLIIQHVIWLCWFIGLGTGSQWENGHFCIFLFFKCNPGFFFTCWYRVWVVKVTLGVLLFSFIKSTMIARV